MMHWNAKCEEGYKSAEHTFYQCIYAAKSNEREWQKFGTIGQFWLVFTETTSAEGVVGTRRDRDGLRLDSAASPFGARRGSGDAPFHSQTADIANPFQNISFLNASSSRWITNLSITSLSRPAFHVAATNTTRRLLLSSLSRISKRNLFEMDCRLLGTARLVNVTTYSYDV